MNESLGGGEAKSAQFRVGDQKYDATEYVLLNGQVRVVIPELGIDVIDTVQGVGETLRGTVMPLIEGRSVHQLRVDRAMRRLGCVLPSRPITANVQLVFDLLTLRNETTAQLSKLGVADDHPQRIVDELPTALAREELQSWLSKM